MEVKQWCKKVGQSKMLKYGLYNEKKKKKKKKKKLLCFEIVNIHWPCIAWFTPPVQNSIMQLRRSHVTKPFRYKTERFKSSHSHVWPICSIHDFFLSTHQVQSSSGPAHDMLSYQLSYFLCVYIFICFYKCAIYILFLLCL